MLLSTHLYLSILLAVQHRLTGSQFPDQGGTHAPCNGSTESQPLDHQGILFCTAFKINKLSPVKSLLKFLTNGLISRELCTYIIQIVRIY